MFVNYLVTNNLVSKKDLIYAVATVSESQPSLLRILIDEKIISEDQAISIIDKQLKSNLSISEILITEKIITAEKLNIAIDKMNSSGKTLIDVLLEKNLLSHQVLVDAVDKYKIEDAKKEEEPKKVNKNVSISEAALESLKELGISDETMIADLEQSSDNKRTEETNTREDNVFAQELLKSLDEKQFNKLLKIDTIIKEAVQNEGDVNTYLNTLYKDFHIIKGAACLAEVNEIENLLDKWESVLENLFDKTEKDIRSWFSNKTEVVVQTVDILKKIKENLKGKQATNDGLEDNYSKVLTLLAA